MRPAVLAFASVLALAGPAAAATTSGWDVRQHPAPSDGKLRSAEPSAVACGSATHCVSVGDYDSIDPSQPHRSFLITLDITVDPTTGSTAAVAAPLPADDDRVDAPHLAAVACSAMRCVAAGSYWSTDGARRPLLETQLRDDRWSVKQFASLHGFLKEAACSDQACVVTGINDSRRLLLVRTTGGWTQPAISMPAGETLFDVHPICPAEGTCVAWGTGGTRAQVRPVLLYPSSSGWTGVNFATPAGVNPYTLHIGGMSCTSTANCVAFGSYDDQPFKGDTKLFAEVLDQGVLRVEHVSLPPAARANPGIAVVDVSCGSAVDPTCVGLTRYGADSPEDGPHGTAAFVVRNGVVGASPTATFGLAGDLSCFTADATTRCVAVSSADGQRIGLYNYDGTDWTSEVLDQRPSGIPRVPSDWSARLGRVSCASGSCLAIGGWATLDQGMFPHDTGALLARVHRGP